MRKIALVYADHIRECDPRGLTPLSWEEFKQLVKLSDATDDHALHDKAAIIINKREGEDNEKLQRIVETRS